MSSCAPSVLCRLTTAHSAFRTQETEKTEKKLKRKKPKKKERLEEEAEEEAGEEVEGGWEKVKGGAPLVKVKRIYFEKPFQSYSSKADQ